jgi:RimJ/RimL family protein N-acetyltransferase
MRYRKEQQLMSDRVGPGQLRIEPWAESDLDLLRRLNSPEMTAFLGGPEIDEQVLARHSRYVRGRGNGTGEMFRIILLPDGEAVGSIGYWEHDWQDATVYETGWSILPDYQGRGIATEAVRLVVERARAERKHGSLHAFPSIDNAASNVVCRKAGFTLVETCDFEYPPGNLMRCNDWRLDFAADV